ncbi:MAG: fused MFS/spermidine synthase [Bacteroidales bacterium]|nr:fused MFS/spermidine synthase [Bacteroidales bacterium]
MKNSGEIIKVFDSEINDKLKVVLKNGKKLLNTKNTNYSYGTLVDVLEYGLDTIPVSEIKSVLLLGMGGGSIIKSLRNKYNCQAPVDAVEIDPVVIDIANKKFNIDKKAQLTIHCADAWDYIKNCKKEYDLIIVDIFIDVHVPEKFYKQEFWLEIEKNVSENGFILFNAGIDLKETEVQEFVGKLPDSFIYQKNYYVLDTNTVIIMQKVF